MRATRAMVGAFGAGVSLAVASSIVLLVVSAVVAFNGWPDDLQGVSQPRVAPLAGTPAAAAAARPAVSVALELPAPAAASPGRPTTQRERGAVAGSVDEAGTTGATQGASGAGTTSAPPAAEDAAPDGRVADTVRDTTSSVGEAVAPVASEVGGTLESVGAAGTETVDAATQGAGSPIQQLLP